MIKMYFSECQKIVNKQIENVIRVNDVTLIRNCVSCNIIKGCTFA